MDFYEEAMRDLAKGNAYTRYIETGEFFSKRKERAEERKIISKFYDWIEPSYKKPRGVKISKEEQEEEEEFYRENPDTPPALWSVGGWADKKDEPPKEKRTVCKG